MEISWVNPKVKSGKSALAGTGVFCLKKINSGEVVAVFGGFIVPISTLKRVRQTNKKIYDTVMNIGYQIDEDLIFSPTSTVQFSDIEYLNHSCEPNCGFADKITLVAMRDIQKGEEISMDYGMCISSPLLEMVCNCKRPKCRKFISKDDWKLSSLQKKYIKYFQPYLKEKVTQIKS